ncbi:hypothetical protein ABEV00_02840 [Paenibacillus thiaminolyticus]|uniref:hypothetical protein n=1 Tax=Paenibacillus thiaminolyticus TaxID=49283 RepID=UPI003D280F9C
MKAMRKVISGLLAATLLLAPVSAFAAENVKMNVNINEARVKVNGKLVQSNVLLYKDKVYATVEGMANLFQLDYLYDEDSTTFYLGMLPAGAISDEVIEAWESLGKEAKKTGELGEVAGDRRATGIVNEYNVSIHAIPIEDDTISIGGNLYVSFQAVADILGLKMKYDKATNTTYVGSIPDSILNPPKKDSAKSKTAQNKKSKMYDVAASGDMKGWRLLKGHPNEKSIAVYYKQDGSILQMEFKDIRKVDLKRKVQWVDDNGYKHTNTVGEIYQLFTLSNEYTSDWFSSKFGKLYTDWMMVQAFHGENLVEDYLRSKGKLK